MSTIEETPFDLIYKQLILDVQEHPIVLAMVKKNNMITYTSSNPKEKQSVQTADLPEIVLWMNRVHGNLHASSSTLHLTTHWSFLNSIGTYDSAVNNALMLAIIAAAVNWKTTLATLRWNNRVFVKDIRLSSLETGLSNAKANRNISGWASLINLEIDVSLLITDVAGV